MISTFDSYGRFFKPGVLFAIVSYWPVKVQLMIDPYIRQRRNAWITSEVGAESDSAPQLTGQLPPSYCSSSQGWASSQQPTSPKTFSLTCVMSWAYRRRESQTPPSPGCLLLSHHQSGSQCVRCFIQHSCVYFWHLAASSDTKEGGGVCCGSPEWGHDFFMFPNLPDHRRLTSNNQNTCL